MKKLEIIIRPERLDDLKNILNSNGAQVIDQINTGEYGDGKIFVYDVYDAIRIRTGERGTDAL